MLVSLYQALRDVESSNSWDSSLASQHKPSFLNNFLQSESFCGLQPASSYLANRLTLLFRAFLGVIFQTKKENRVWNFQDFGHTCPPTTAVHCRYLFTLNPTFVVKSTFQKAGLWEITLWFICRQNDSTIQNWSYIKNSEFSGTKLEIVFLFL